MDSIDIKDIKKELINDEIIEFRDVKSERGVIHIVYDGSLCNFQYISDHILTPLMRNTKSIDTIEKVKEEVITSASVGDVNSLQEAIDHILSGDVVIIFTFLNQTIFCIAKGYPKRAIEIPPTETVIKGPREGLTEDIVDNIASIRRRVRTAEVKFENIILGEKTKTSVTLIYLEGVAPKKLVDYVRTKINSVKNESVIYSSQIEEKIKCKGTPFDTIGYTEKPDIVAMKLCEGRVAVLTNGTPFAIIAPYFFIESFHTTDDYSLNRFFGNTGTVLRWASFLASTLLPGLYVALFTHHFNLIPYIFVFRMATSRAGVPFPMAVEVIIMIVFFQILREAGVRLPQQIGPTLSIVGALILGDAAVQSGLASQVTVLIAALTSIASFLVPGVSNAIFIWNIIILLFGAFLGLPGFFMGFVVFVAHISNLTSCGYPYLYPLGTLTKFKYHDVLLRGDLEKINENIFIKDEDK
jgi:spore germination protein KA